MALNIMKVSLTATGELDVEDANKNSVGPGQGINVFVWTLDSQSLPNARFEKLASAPPAFTWISTPPKYTFSKPRVTDDGQRLMLDDNHVSAASAGDFIYMLRVRADAGNGTYKYYTTTTTKSTEGSIRTTDNPVIINR